MSCRTSTRLATAFSLFVFTHKSCVGHATPDGRVWVWVQRREPKHALISPFLAVLLTLPSSQLLEPVTSRTATCHGHRSPAARSPLILHRSRRVIDETSIVEYLTCCRQEQAGGRRQRSRYQLLLWNTGRSSCDVVDRMAMALAVTRARGKRCWIAHVKHRTFARPTDCIRSSKLATPHPSSQVVTCSPLVSSRTQPPRHCSTRSSPSSPSPVPQPSRLRPTIFCPNSSRRGSCFGRTLRTSMDWRDG